ncbi:MAG: UDP-N-acetylglucosamine 1-carboxyvinyltransferase [candidate division WOR-3 bacterium]|nr:UDP-N-acetylglucosamine 1-carboxyvinyltransferase [candidate division WOR-3 bacterium]
MDKLVIKGKKRLSGSVRVSGSKNATLPIMAACLLTDQPCRIKNIPELSDIKTMASLLAALGTKVEINGKEILIKANDDIGFEAPYEIVSQMRASYYVLGPLLARFGQAKVSLPGGCAIGPRPVDLHLKGMEHLGAQINIEHGYINARASKLTGTEMTLEGIKGPSVGATANVMMAAAKAKGNTVITGAACEPEVVDLANFLGAMGAKIEGAGTPLIKIHGVNELSGCEYEPIPDRIEAGTLAIAAAITGSEIEITGLRLDHMKAVIEQLETMGCKVNAQNDSLRISLARRPAPTEIFTAPYPGFPTDLQAQFMALLTLSTGTSVITENIFEARFLHALELNRMGAKISIKGNSAVIEGVDKLSGAQVMASDLRASAALVLAGLAAEGETEVSRIYHLDRGYENLDVKLAKLGAAIQRVQDE